MQFPFKNNFSGKAPIWLMSLELMLSPLCRAIHPTSINLLGKERGEGDFKSARLRLRETWKGGAGDRDVPRIGEWAALASSGWSFREGNVQLKQNWQRARISSPPLGNLHLIRPKRSSDCEEWDTSGIQAKAISALSVWTITEGVTWSFFRT